jgi:cysteinyl-tRNA synthetase
VLQDYKLAYQKHYRSRAAGPAYRVLQAEGPRFLEVKTVEFGDIEECVDLLSLETQQQLSPRTVHTKITERELARKRGEFTRADEIRRWLKIRGVDLKDCKHRNGRTTWSYLVDE